MDLLHQKEFDEYVNDFVQRTPKYAAKKHDGSWKTIKRSLDDETIKAHLKGLYSVGVLGRWYPGFSLLDFDERGINEVEELRQDMGLNEENSMLCKSESPNSYHLIFKPSYKGEPPTLRLLNMILSPYGKRFGIEVYPKKSKTIRLPFGPTQRCLDHGYYFLNDWWDKNYWFHKLDDLELSDLNHQMIADLRINSMYPEKGTLKEGEELLEHGLQLPGTRHEAQFKILYYLWRNNIHPETAKQRVWGWIKKKHNGFSKEFNRGHFQIIQDEIAKQAAHIWGKYELKNIYPDSTHNSHDGFITKRDIENIVRKVNASRPRMKFLFYLVKYSYPRQQKSFISIHSSKLASWAGLRTYQKYLDELAGDGIVNRGKSYMPGRFSKDLKLNWKFQDPSQAVLYEGRAVDTFEDTVCLTFEPREFRALLESAGAERTTAIEAVKGIFVKKGKTSITSFDSILEGKAINLHPTNLKKNKGEDTRPFFAKNFGPRTALEKP
jgi:hypothetical protein